MKTKSLLTTASMFSVLLIFTSGVAHAEVTPPPLTPIKIFPAGSGAAVKPVVQPSVEIKPEVKPEAKPEIKAETKPADQPATVVSTTPPPKFGDDQFPAPPPAKNGQKTVLIPVTKVPARRTPRIAIRVLPRGRGARGVPAPRPYVHNTDLAMMKMNSCLSATKLVVRCMDRHISAAETKLDSAEVRLMNCGELRKIENGFDSKIESLVVSKMVELRRQTLSSMQADLSEMQAAHAPLRYTRAVQLRATLKHLDDVNALADKVCDAKAFQGLFAASSN